MNREHIAKRVAQEVKDGDVVNLGIGLPTMIANYVPKEIDITLQSENGFLGLGPAPAEEEADPDLIDAGGQPVTIYPGGSFFDASVSFGIIRGGHVNITVLGALQVDEKGNLANWMIPGKMGPGMGGAMDLATGAKRVIIAMEHLTKDGRAKIVKECTLPLTAKGKVNLIITEMAVMKVTTKGLLLTEIADHLSVIDVQKATEADLIVAENLISGKGL